MSLKRAPEPEQSVPKKKVKLLRKELFAKQFKVGDYVKYLNKIYVLHDFNRVRVRR